MSNEKHATPAGAAARLRAYLDALPTTVMVGAEFAYGKQFRSDEWAHDSYCPTRNDLLLLLNEVQRLRTELAATPKETP